MNNNTSYNEALAKKAASELIVNISKFLCKNKLIVDRLKYNLDKCQYDTEIVIDIEEGLFKLGLSLADLLRYWDDSDVTIEE